MHNLGIDKVILPLYNYLTRCTGEKVRINIMTENEIKLLSLIRSDNNPSEAVVVAIRVISDFLTQPLSFQEASPVVPRALP